VEGRGLVNQIGDHPKLTNPVRVEDWSNATFWTNSYLTKVDKALAMGDGGHALPEEILFGI
jgi:hypothetical protein